MNAAHFTLRHRGSFCRSALRCFNRFTLTVKQGAATRLQRIYGKRSTPKIWGFGWSALNHEIAGAIEALIALKTELRAPSIVLTFDEAIIEEIWNSLLPKGEIFEMES